MLTRAINMAVSPQLRVSMMKHVPCSPGQTMSSILTSAHQELHARSVQTQLLTHLETILAGYLQNDPLTTTILVRSANKSEIVNTVVVKMAFVREFCKVVAVVIHLNAILDYIVSTQNASPFCPLEPITVHWTRTVCSLHV